MNMMLMLPHEQLAKYADAQTRHFVDNTAYVEQMLYRAQNYRDDPRKEDPTEWELTRLANWCYLELNGAEEYKEKWKVAIDRFIQDKKIRAREYFKHPELFPSPPPELPM